MKTLLLIILGILLLLLASVQVFISFDMAKTETQPYQVKWKQNEFEARYYPKAIVATVSSSSSTYKGSSNTQFRILAGYIFGGNESGESIAMTSPVHMSFSENRSTMSFVMPAEMELEKLPMPKDRGIQLDETTEKYAVSIQFGGWASDAKIAVNAKKLIDKLNEAGIQIKSKPWYMGYNPPYQIFNPRNEVAVEISAEDIARL